VSSDQATLVIGTAPGWVTDRAKLRFGFEFEGLKLEANDPKAYEEGSMGWVVDEPTFVLPDGSSYRFRQTTICRQEDGRWKMVHMHASVGVPDEEVIDLQKRWGT
jgi:hypothetical protein